jgi:DDE family transposase/transposase-like protein DUF772
MQLTSHALLMQFAQLLQMELFPRVEEELGALSESGRRLLATLSMVSISELVAGRGRQPGRPRHDRRALATAFLAKAIYNLQTTRQLIERLQVDSQLRRLCGWSSARALPNESTFSRAFAQFARTELPHRLHAAVLADTGTALHIEHVARDSTAIPARERFPEGRPKRQQTCAKRGKTKRQRQGRRGPHRRAKARDRGPRLERQQYMTLAEMIADLPVNCSLGVKTSSDGNQEYWRGYKLHLDVADGQIPVSCILTGASVHDSQVAIPLMTMSAARVQWRYDVMDSAYDAKRIRKRSQAMGHIPVIKPVKRHRFSRQQSVQPSCELTTEEQEIFRHRTVVERVNARLKDEFGARSVRVRGAVKVMAHLMFGVVALTVDQILRQTAASP